MANLRKKLNDWVKEKGNKYTPTLTKSGKGLGDILTLEINSCRKVGAVAGAMAPSIFIYNANDSIYWNFMKEAVVNGTLIVPLATGFAGYALGVILDEFFGEKTLEELYKKYEKEELERRYLDEQI
ncbi:MAG: hypothetical protein KKF52_00020 [Nanoarchaeota archaeon]|nr:hypothetical protein [Nanoarchaeota archaeon]MBU4241595.1 hypothetical protein [Nanoarchaeota archaeon]MBU4352073.1 hypothetical protein [Nanoarchaeota archaeon]